MMETEIDRERDGIELKDLAGGAIDKEWRDLVDDFVN